MVSVMSVFVEVLIHSCMNRMSSLNLFLWLKENQVAHEYKLKATENGQPDHKAQLEELSLALGWVKKLVY